MSEKSLLQSEQSEDPLPSKLGELISDDLCDPFVWLSNIHGIHPSEAAKNIMWMLYRMSGHFPSKENGPGKERDETRMDHMFKRVTESDQKFIDDYEKYLVKFDAEKASRRLLEEMSKVVVEHQPMPVLHEPNSELVALAIRLSAEANDSKDVAA